MIDVTSQAFVLAWVFLPLTFSKPRSDPDNKARAYFVNFLLLILTASLMLYTWIARRQYIISNNLSTSNMLNFIFDYSPA
tara:strand:+ start:2161 stop:2400 length:240 start_codon:yes stop_codon:yes gene_type:complete